jgi:hypothetical protein
MTIRIIFSFWCGNFGKQGHATLIKEYQDLPIPPIGSTIAVGDGHLEFSSKVQSIVIDPDTRIACVFLEKNEYSEDEHEDFDTANQWFKDHGWK